MLEREYPGQNCSIARALEIVGERWTLLIIRDAFLGMRRFEQFQQSLGIARNVLTDRLNRLVDEGILERVRYGERPVRHEYQLTPKGRDLLLSLTAFRQWGDKYLSPKPPILLRRKSDRKLVVAALVAKGSGGLRGEQLELVPGPGANRTQEQWWRDSISSLGSGIGRPANQVLPEKEVAREARVCAERDAEGLDEQRR